MASRRTSRRAAFCRTVLDSDAVDALLTETLPPSNKPVKARTSAVTMSDLKHQPAVASEGGDKSKSLLARLLEALEPEKTQKAEEKKKSRKRRKKEEVKEEPEEVARCECGVTEDDGQLFIACDTCGVWSHAACHGFTAETVPDVWHCCL